MLLVGTQPLYLEPVTLLGGRFQVGVAMRNTGFRQKHIFIPASMKITPVIKT